jgi:hypothetical protein
VGQWTTFQAPSSVGSFNSDTVLLLTDGSVLIHEAYGANWLRLKPDKHGNYKTGEWSGLLKMSLARQFFASGVLRDGRVFVLGGEYSGPKAEDNDSPLGEIFDPQTNKWGPLNKLKNFEYIKGDVSSSILADGRVLFGNLQGGPPFAALWDPATEVWTEAGTAFGTKSDTKRSNCNEETWTLLPDGSVLTVAINTPKNEPLSERYVPSLDEWVPSGETPKSLPIPTVTDPKGNVVNVFEIGPALLLPDGNVLAIGASGQNAIYEPPPKGSDPATSAGTWVPAQAFPADTTSGKSWPTLTACDAPGVLQTNGKVLCVAGTLHEIVEVNAKGEEERTYFSKESEFFEFDPTGKTLQPFPNPPFSPSSAPETWPCRLLLLPNAQILLTTQAQTINLYEPTAAENSPQASWRPKLTNPPTTLVAGHTYTIEGEQLNGLSQANSYGDDAQMATNFPIVQLSNSKGEVVYLRTLNFSTLGVATEKESATAEVEVPKSIEPGSWSMVVIANGIESATVEVEVAAQDCEVIFARDTFGEGEIKAMINLSGAPTEVSPALYVVVEGYTAEEVGLTTTASLSNPPTLPQIAEPIKGIKAVFAGPVLPQDQTLPAKEVQSFTFPFALTFAGESVFAGAPEQLIVTAKFDPPKKAKVEGSGEIFLIANPNPFILHGDEKEGFEWYLSSDVRVFHLKAGERRFEVELASSGDPKVVAAEFIREVIENLNEDTASAGPLFEKISQEEDVAETQLALEPEDGHGNRLYNFALARVRLQDVAEAKEVGVFFRMWQAQQTNATFDASTIYKSLANPDKVPIPVLGVEGDEIITIPFFAEPRVDSSTESMDKQIDTLNRRSIKPDKLGGEAFAYFGCWLDINQPGESWFPDRMVGGVPADIPAGPFTGMGQLQSIQQLVRSTHQCLIAEVNYNLDPIPDGADPSNSDKLAQRNLTLVSVPNPGMPASRRAPQTIEIRPTPVPLLAGHRPDELMIDWGEIPHGSSAELYLPRASSGEILEMAARMYATHRLKAVDAHTIAIDGGGVSYVPVPGSADGLNLMGLFSVNLPAGIHKGEEFELIVRQLTSASRAVGVRTEALAVGGEALERLKWRRTLGLFKLNIPVGTRASLLESEERTLSIMRWIGQSIPVQSRWFPVFGRYLGQLAERVQEMGGNPVLVVPTPTGNWNGRESGEGHGEGRRGRGGREGGHGRGGEERGGRGHGRGHRRECCEEEIEVTGKIVDLVHDRFGDFDGFRLQERCSGELLRFWTRHDAMVEVVEYAWREQITVSVFAHDRDREVPVAVVYREPPRA